MNSMLKQSTANARPIAAASATASLLTAALATVLLTALPSDAFAGREVKNNTRTSVNKNSNTNVNRNTNVNVNKNTNVNVNSHRHVDIDVDVDRGFHPVATVAAVAVTAAVIGSVVYTLPPSGCYPVQIGAMLYQQCGAYWYQPQYYGTTVQYVVVNPPR